MWNWCSGVKHTWSKREKVQKKKKKADGAQQWKQDQVGSGYSGTGCSHLVWTEQHPAELPCLRGDLSLHQPLLCQVLILNVWVVIQLVQSLKTQRTDDFFFFYIKAGVLTNKRLKKQEAANELINQVCHCYY